MRAKNVVITFSDIMTLYVHSGHDKSHLATNSERCSRPSALSRSIHRYIKLFCAGRNVLDI
jgi:hypothetical protein